MSAHDFIDLLATELVIEIFASLGRTDLRNCSYASRRLRSIVHSLDHYHLITRLKLGSSGALYLQSEANIFEETMRGLSTTTIPIAFELTLNCYPGVTVAHTHLKHPVPPAEQSMKDIINSVCVALLHVRIIRLEIRIKEAHQFSDILPVLRAPAPRLRRVVLVYGKHYYYDNRQPPPRAYEFPRVELPAHSFDGSPDLREVKLWNVALPPVPSPAFAQTTLFEYQDINFNGIHEIIRQFPQLQHLSLIVCSTHLMASFFDTVPLPQFPITLRRLEIAPGRSSHPNMARGLKLMVPPQFDTLVLRHSHPVAVVPFIQYFLPEPTALEGVAAYTETSGQVSERVRLTLAYQASPGTEQKRGVRLIILKADARQWKLAKETSPDCSAQIARIFKLRGKKPRPFAQYYAGWGTLLRQD